MLDGVCLEHSHNQFVTSVTASLQANNPDEIQDGVFGLLGAAAAIKGAGKITVRGFHLPRSLSMPVLTLKFDCVGYRLPTTSYCGPSVHKRQGCR